MYAVDFLEESSVHVEATFFSSIVEMFENTIVQNFSLTLDTQMKWRIVKKGR